MNETKASLMDGLLSPSNHTSTQDAKMDMLLLRLADRRFLLPLEQVEEINRPLPLTPLPLGPGHVLGLANLRGKTLCVIDPGVRMGLLGSGEQLALSKQRFVTLRHPHMHVAIRVDTVEDIHAIRTSDIAHKDHAGMRPPGMADYVTGSIEIDGFTYDVLDGGALLC
ncbi:MAG: chemotaxis protein CheW [Mariprofundaceae bacterium]